MPGRSAPPPRPPGGSSAAAGTPPHWTTPSSGSSERRHALISDRVTSRSGIAPKYGRIRRVQQRLVAAHRRRPQAALGHVPLGERLHGAHRLLAFAARLGDLACLGRRPLVAVDERSLRERATPRHPSWSGSCASGACRRASRTAPGRTVPSRRSVARARRTLVVVPWPRPPECAACFGRIQLTPCSGSTAMGRPRGKGCPNRVRDCPPLTCSFTLKPLIARSLQVGLQAGG